MKSAASDRASAIFFALSVVSGDERAKRLDEECQGDAGLRQEVERLLRALDEPESEVSPIDKATKQRDGISLAPGSVVGDFVVVRQIGAGATGVVYLAHQQHPPRVVALKVLRREFMASAVQRRFEIEAEVLAHLQHPGIAHIYAAHPGDAATPPFIAMELVNGPALTEFADVRRLSVRERVELMANICNAVQHAHQRGIIHRDLKPGNILVGEDGQPKVLDFGVARRMDMPAGVTIATEAGQLVGTLAYMSPEQVRAQPGSVDTRTDVHALGVILFRLLSGRLPFGHGEPSLPELARRIVEDEPTRLGTLDTRFKGDLETIVAHALAKEKSRRYTSVADLEEDLRRFLRGEPISASADSAWYLVRKRIGRYRLALAFSAATTAIIGGLGFYALLQRGQLDRVNAQLADQLVTSTIEQGRLISVSGNHPVAEELVWRELFRRPESRHAQWALWDMYSREPVLWTKVEHETGTMTVRFSPDNRRLLTSGRLDGELHLLDVETGELVRRMSAQPVRGMLRAFFVPDGSKIVSGSVDGRLQIWNVDDGQLLGESAPIRGLRDLAIALGGAAVAAVGDEGLTLWSVETAQQVADLSTLVPRGTNIASHLPGSLSVVGGSDGSVTVVDLASRRKVWQVHGHDAEVLAVGISPDAQMVVSGDIPGLIRLWSAADGAPIRAIDSENGRVRSFAFDARNTMMVVAGQWRTRIWNMSDLSAPPRDVGGSEGVTDVHVRPDGRGIATCDGGAGRLRVWDLIADSRLDRWPDHRGSVNGLALVDDGQVVIAAGAGGGISIRRAGIPDPIAVVSAEGSIRALDLSDDGRWFVTVGTTASSAVWDARDGHRIASLPGAEPARAVVFAEGDRLIVSGELDGTIRIWDWRDQMATNPRTFRSGDYEVLALAARDGRLTIGNGGRGVFVRDQQTGAETLKLATSAAVFSFALSADGRTLYAGTYSGAIEVFDLESRRKVRDLKGQTAVIYSLDLSDDGALLASASRDGTTRLWDVSGQFLATVAVRRSGAVRARFFPDGRRLALGYEDGEVEIRNLDHFFRHAAGQIGYQRQLFRLAGESFPLADGVETWGRTILANRW